MSAITPEKQFYRGVRSCIAWLHAHADTMNDPHARRVLNGAAFSLGVDKPTPCGVETTPADQPAVDSQVSGGSDPTVYPPTPTPPGGDTRLSGEVEEVCARLEQRCGRGSVEHEAADLLRQLAADNATRKALCEEAIELGKSYQSGLQACEAERDRRTEIVRGEYNHWLKEAARHKRPSGANSDHAARDLERAKVAQRILAKFVARQALKDNDHE